MYIQYHIFSTHLSIDRCKLLPFLGYIVLQLTLGCIYLFEVVFLFSLDKHPEVEVLDCMILCFHLAMDRHSVFHSGCYQLTFPLIVEDGSLFSIYFQTSIISCFLDDSHSGRCEVKSH